MHIWTNTFTKHSKCYKMACIGPIGGFLSNLDLCTNQSSAPPPRCTADSGQQRLVEPENLHQRHQKTPFHFDGAATKPKEKKRSFVLRGPSLRYQTQVKRGGLLWEGGRPNRGWCVKICLNTFTCQDARVPHVICSSSIYTAVPLPLSLPAIFTSGASNST